MIVVLARNEQRARQIAIDHGWRRVNWMWPMWTSNAARAYDGELYIDHTFPSHRDAVMLGEWAGCVMRKEERANV